MMRHQPRTVHRALYRARLPILTVGLAYAMSVSLGIYMVHAGSDVALSYRDRIVERAQSSPIIVALRRDDRAMAAVLDFSANLFGSAGTALAGLGVVTAYPIVGYRGWIGGIVSVNRSRVSRFADSREAAYYLTTLILQLIPYTLAGGAGVNLGLAVFRPQPHYQNGRRWGIPTEAIRDGLRIYSVAVPLFLLASIWEFFLR